MKYTGFLDEDDIDNFLLDSYNEESIDILAIFTSKKSEIGSKPSVNNHCVILIGELLYHVASEWINHRGALMKCG